MIARTQKGHAKAVHTGSPCAKKQGRYCPAGIDKPRFYGQSPMRKNNLLSAVAPRARPEQFIACTARIALWQQCEQAFATAAKRRVFALLRAVVHMP